MSEERSGTINWDECSEIYRTERCEVSGWEHDVLEKNKINISDALPLVREEGKSEALRKDRAKYIGQEYT